MGNNQAAYPGQYFTATKGTRTTHARTHTLAHARSCTLLQIPMTVHYAYGPGSMARFKGISIGHMKALRELKPQQIAADPSSAVSDPPTTCTTVARRPRKQKCCAWQERCVAVGDVELVCSHAECTNKCHRLCGGQFAPGDVVCPLHTPRGMAVEYKVTARTQSKRLYHLPTKWADRWANTKSQPGKVRAPRTHTHTHIRTHTHTHTHRLSTRRD